MVNRAPRGTRLGIQGAVYHGCRHGRADDMRPRLSGLSGIDQVIFRDNRRAQVRGQSRCGKRRPALPEFIYARDIYGILREILRPRYGITVFFNILNLLVLTRSALLIIQIIGNRILHILPGHIHPLVSSPGGYVVRLIRLARRQGNRRHLRAVAAAPRAVYGLHANPVLQVIGQLLAPKAGNIQGIHRCQHRLLAAALADSDLIACNIDARIPLQPDLLVACRRGKVLRNILLRLGNPLLHAVDKFHHGYLRQVVILCDSLYGKGDLLQRHLSPKVKPDRPVSVLLHPYIGIFQKMMDAVHHRNLHRLACPLI